MNFNGNKFIKMRKINVEYSVSYVVIQPGTYNGNHLRKDACYGSVFSDNSIITQQKAVVLGDYLAEGTSEYAEKYIKKLSKIFDIKCKFLNKDKSLVEISNIQSKLYLKMFLTMFRILFENCNNKPELNIKFVKNFVENTYKIKDLLKRFIHCHMKTGLFLGGNHCIKFNKEHKMLLQTKKDLQNYKYDNYAGVQNFFCRKKIT